MTSSPDSADLLSANNMGSDQQQIAQNVNVNAGGFDLMAYTDEQHSNPANYQHSVSSADPAASGQQATSMAHTIGDSPTNEGYNSNNITSLTAGLFETQGVSGVSALSRNGLSDTSIGPNLGANYNNNQFGSSYESCYPSAFLAAQQYYPASVYSQLLASATANAAYVPQPSTSPAPTSQNCAQFYQPYFAASASHPSSFQSLSPHPPSNLSSFSGASSAPLGHHTLQRDTSCNTPMYPNPANVNLGALTALQQQSSDTTPPQQHTLSSTGLHGNQSHLYSPLTNATSSSSSSSSFGSQPVIGYNSASSGVADYLSSAAAAAAAAYYYTSYTGGSSPYVFSGNHPTSPALNNVGGPAVNPMYMGSAGSMMSPYRSIGSMGPGSSLRPGIDSCYFRSQQKYSLRKKKCPSPAPEHNYDRVFIWDLDETLIIFHSLLTGSFAQRFGKESSRGVQLALALESLIFSVADSSFFFNDLEDCGGGDQIHIEDVITDDNGIDLNSYNFAADGFSSTSITSDQSTPGHGMSDKNPSAMMVDLDNSKGQNKTPHLPHPSVSLSSSSSSARGGVDYLRKLSYRYRKIKETYQTFRNANIAGLLGNKHDQWAQIRADIEQFTDNWHSFSYKALGAISARCNQVNVLVTTSQLVPAIVKCLLFGMAPVLDIDNIYSATKIGKEECFERVMQKFGRKCTYVCIGDGKDEEQAAKSLDIPFWRVSSHADYVSLLHAIELEYL